MGRPWLHFLFPSFTVLKLFSVHSSLKSLLELDGFLLHQHPGPAPRYSGSLLTIIRNCDKNKIMKLTKQIKIVHIDNIRSSFASHLKS